MKRLNSKAVEDSILRNPIYFFYFHEYAVNVLIIGITSMFPVSHVLQNNIVYKQ